MVSKRAWDLGRIAVVIPCYRVSGQVPSVIATIPARVARIDTFPLLVGVQKTGKVEYDTDLLIDQVRAISTRWLMYLYSVEEAL